MTTLLHEALGEVSLRSRTGTSVVATVESWRWSSSMQEAPSLELTLSDDDYDLRRSVVLDRQGDEVLDRGVTLRVLGAALELVAVDPQGRQLVATLEPRHVQRLKRAVGKRSFREAAYTRTGALRVLVRETPGVELRSTVRGDREQAARERAAEAKAAADARDGATSSSPDPVAEPAVADGEDLTVKGAPATRSQKSLASQAMQVAEAQRAGPKATKALVEALIVEAELSNPTGGDRSSVGPLQLLDTHLGGSASTDGGRRDVSLVCRLFLTDGFTGLGGAIQLARQNPRWTAGQVAQAVQGSAYPGRYDQVGDEADEWLEAYDGGVQAGTSSSPRVDVTLGSFGRGVGEGAQDDESTWQTGLRFADDQRFAFYSYFLPVVVFADERELLRQKARYVVRPHDELVDWVDGGWDAGHGVDTLRLSLRLGPDPGAIRAGDVLVVRDAGAQDGRYLAQDAALSSSDDAWDVTLRRARDPKRPTVTATARTTPAADGTKVGRTTDAQGRDADPIAELKRVAQRVSAANAPYSHAGHGVPLASMRDAQPNDCSSGLAYILWSTNHDWFNHDAAIVSGQFASGWASPGAGDRLTVWANGGHVFAQAEDADGHQWRIDTGAGRAPHYVDGWRSTAGFTPRHLKGL